MGDPIDDDNAGKIQQKAQKIADGLRGAVGQAGDAAWSAGAGIAEFRQIIRGQPLTMAFLMLGLGYVVGRVLNSRPYG
ncbi:MAG TPA: hypothetical protein VGH36_05215 [Acetobacteraceae bacterium]